MKKDKLDERIKYIAVVGGFYNLKTSEAKKAKVLAAEIGAAFAKAKLGLVVYLSDNNSLETYVVSGYVNSLPSGFGSKTIRVRFAESQRDIVKFLEQETREEVFDRKVFAGNDWEAPFYRTLVEAEGVDGVLLMAGGRSTLIAGQIAIARPLPILAIDQFDGSAGLIWSELATTSKDYPSSTTHNTEELAFWLKNECNIREKRNEQLIQMEKTYNILLSQKRKSFWTAGVFVLLLTTLVLGMAFNPIPEIFSILMFFGLIMAGATGALVRSLIWGTEKTNATISVILGGAAGFLVGLAYLIPQWVGAPGVLEPTNTSIEVNDKIQFASSILVAFPAGIGFDTIFNRMRQQSKDLQITPSK